MANFDITQGTELKEVDLLNKSLLAFDNNALYKLTLNKTTIENLTNAGLLVGKNTTDSAEVFNDYKNNLATGAFSHAEGKGTQATSEGMHAQGTYNKTTTGLLHVVGNGTGPETNNRSDAHTLDKEGNAWFAGDVKAGNISLKDIYNILEAEGTGKRRPVVRFGTDAPNSNTPGEIGDIYCMILS